MKIAVLGYGMEGKASVSYFLKRGNDVTICDEREDVDTGDIEADVGVRLGAEAFTNLNDFDMVIRTAGLAPHKIKTTAKIWSATNEFFEKCPAPIIGVTGSKGKGTTCSFIASILESADKTVHLVGNIGKPALDELQKITKDDIVVYELSSFQLWDIEYSPHTAVVLHIEPDHLDVHSSYEDYVSAKARITLFQNENDVLIYNHSEDVTRQIARDSHAQTVAYLHESGLHERDGYFYIGDQKLCSTEAVKLPGVHNRHNAMAAIGAAWTYTQSIESIERGLSEFEGLDHRLAYVATVDGVDYYDDSIATTPGSAIAALRAFDQPKVLILGGHSKGADFTELAREVANQRVRKVILLGDEADVIAGKLEDASYRDYNIIRDASMEMIVAKANEVALSGDVVILSPSCASFGLFKNYKDRGEQFVTCVKNL